MFLRKCRDLEIRLTTMTIMVDFEKAMMNVRNPSMTNFCAIVVVVVAMVLMSFNDNSFIRIHSLL